MAQYKDTPFYTMDDKPDYVKICLVGDDIVSGDRTVVMQMGIPEDQADTIISLEHLIAILQLKSGDDSPDEFGQIQIVRHPDDKQWVAHYAHVSGALLKFHLVSEDDIDGIVEEMEDKIASQEVTVGTEEWFNSLFPTK
jgi:hypothetical protein